MNRTTELPFFYRPNQRTKTLVLWLSLLSAVSRSHSQSPSDLEWTYFGPEQGLGMSITDILQDSQGFIWLGSSNGVYRYDGYRFRSFKKYTGHSTGLSSDSTWDLEEDAEGNIWIATHDGGICKWERASGKFTFFTHRPEDPNSLSGNIVFKILIDPAGQVWAVVRTPEGILVLDRLNPSTGKVKRYRQVKDDPRSLSCDTISLHDFQSLQLHPLYLDPEGRVWVATNNGLNRYDRRTDSFTSYRQEEDNPHSLTFAKVLTVQASASEKGVYWVRSASPGLKDIALDRLDSATGRVERWGRAGDARLSSLGYYESRNESAIWLADRALYRFAGKDRLAPFRRIELGEERERSDLRVAVFGHRDGHLFLPLLGDNPLDAMRGSDDKITRNGVFFLPAGADQPIFLARNPTDPTLPFGHVLAIMEDRSGIVWLGANRGVYKLKIPRRDHPSKPVFENYPLAKNNGPGLLSTDIRDVYEESPTIFWLATQGGGLARLDRRTGRIVHFLHQPSDPRSIGSNDVYALWGDTLRNELWIGHEEGIDRLDLSGRPEDRPFAARFRRLTHPDGLLNDRFNEIHPAGDGRLWLGSTRRGLLLFDPATERVDCQLIFREHHPDTAHSAFINKVYVDGLGQTWAAPGMGGLCRLRCEQGDYEYQCFLDGLFIVDFFEAPDGLLWCAAMNYGLVKFNPADGTHQIINMENRLTRNSVMGIEGDALGRIWFTSVGLTRYDPEEDTYRIYGRKAGVEGLDPERCLFKSRSGELFYAAPHSALQIFVPEKVRDNPVAPKVVFTDFRLFDEPVLPEKGGPLEENVEVAKEILLGYDQHFFSFEFAGLEYSDPGKNQYRYQLKGVDQHWIYAGANREARYNSVRPGRYVFQVEAANSDGVWSEEPATIQVVIFPPWWLRRPVLLLFALLLFGILRTAYRRQLNRKLALAEARRLREIDALKNRLYTNITHEFRTPLMVILGMAEEVVQRPEKWFREGMEMIVRNGRRLLELVDQLLDLRKIESGAMTINMQLGDVLFHLRYIAESFHSFAASKQIDLRFSSSLETYQMDYDPESLVKILSNLLSNAIKFTPAGGAVRVAVETYAAAPTGVPSSFLSNAAGSQEMLEIKVTDNGIGISPEKQERIFDRFYQVDDSPTRKGEGVGIGLALVWELVRLLGGEVRVESPAPAGSGKGTEFSVLLPVTRFAARSENVREVKVPMVRTSPEVGETPSQPFETPADKSLALIIEDNPDVIRYLRACLEERYALIAAQDGKMGIELALEHIPDLIISDVMMPEKDGFEVTDTLKRDERTSHIPIILLTARTAVEDRIAGLERGADVYLAKPFNPRELLVRMEQLIQLRRRLRERYAGLSSPPAAADPALKIEDAFVRKVRQAIEERLDDPDFNVEALSQLIFLSPPQVHRKLKALTGKSTGHFIRTVRLQHGRILLQTTDKTVGEIAAAVGFNDPAYFSRVFAAEFGQSPSEMRG